MFVVANAPIAVPREASIERVVVPGGMDEADHWIAERARPGAIVITADIPLASRSVKVGATTIAPNGRVFTEDAIGMALATRNLMDDLRSAGGVTQRPAAVRTEGSLGVSGGAGSRHRPSQAGRLRRGVSASHKPVDRLSTQVPEARAFAATLGKNPFPCLDSGSGLPS